MTILIMKNITNNTIYTVQEFHTFYHHLKLHDQSFYFHQYFHYSLQPVYQLVFFIFTIFKI